MTKCLAMYGSQCPKKPDKTSSWPRSTLKVSWISKAQSKEMLLSSRSMISKQSMKSNRKLLKRVTKMTSMKRWKILMRKL